MEVEFGWAPQCSDGPWHRYERGETDMCLAVSRLALSAAPSWYRGTLRGQTEHEQNHWEVNLPQPGSSP